MSFFFKIYKQLIIFFVYRWFCYFCVEMVKIIIGEMNQRTTPGKDWVKKAVENQDVRKKLTIFHIKFPYFKQVHTPTCKFVVYGTSVGI